MLKTGLIPTRQLFQGLWLVLACILVAACQNDDLNKLEQSTKTRAAENIPIPSPRVLPTVYPTRTSIPLPAPTETRPIQPTEVPNTPIAFDQTVVELTYAVPSIGLERSMRANVSSVLELNDVTAAETVTLRDQIGVIYELQQSLPELNLNPLPENCPGCVQLTYNLPLLEIQDHGWLTNTQMLASLENFTSANLRPHYPEGTVLGYRKSATPFNAAHTIALTSEGELWFWSAVDGELSEPQLDEEFAASARLLLADLDLDQIPTGYSAPCPSGSGLENVYINVNDEPIDITFVCPELSLPKSFLPLYTALEEKVGTVLVDRLDDEPPAVVPLRSLVHYQKSDGSKMSLLGDGSVHLTDSDGIVFTQTLTVSTVISLTTVLSHDVNLREGAAAFSDFESENLIFVRGPDSVSSLGWFDGESSLDRESMNVIEELLQELLEQAHAGLEQDVDDRGTATPTTDDVESEEP